MDWVITKSIETFIENLTTDCIDFMVMIMTYFNLSGERLLNLPMVQNVIIYCQALGATLITLLSAYNIFVNNQLRDLGDSEADLGGAIRNTIYGVAFVSATPWLTKFIHQLGISLLYDVSSLTNGQNTPVDLNNVQVLSAALTALLASASGMIIIIAIIIIIALVLILIILFQSVIRAVDLVATTIIGCVLAATLALETDQYSTWFKELVSLSVTQVIQFFMLRLSFELLITGAFGGVENGIINLLLFLAALYTTYKMPNTLKMYVQSTGVGRGTGGLARSAMSSLGSMIMKK